MEAIYGRRMKVPLHGVGPGGTLRLSGALNLFQDLSSEQSESLGFSILDIVDQGYKVVVSRYHFRVWRFPSWGEEILVRTWRSGISRGFGVREYEIVDSDGTPLVAASGSFALVSAKTGERVAFETVFGDYPVLERRALDAGFDPIAPLTKVAFERRFRVRRHDLDVHRHVNHVRFLEWAMESIPDDIYSRCVPFFLEVGFRGEALFGDGIIAQSQAVEEAEALPGGKASGPCPARTGSEDAHLFTIPGRSNGTRVNTPNESIAGAGGRHLFLHRILRERDGKELTVLKTGWRPLADMA